MYNEPVERTERRLCIYKSQKTYEELKEKIENDSNERELQAILKEDLSFFSFLASPPEEYICLPELKIGHKSVDFVVLTSRSSMVVYLIEIKGANFKTFNSNHYGSENYNITNANMQIKNHIEYIKKIEIVLINIFIRLEIRYRINLITENTYLVLEANCL